ncbi:MAG TPA: hypothetical protein VMW25_06660 [Clostridia bacterium]|nr:hypothetical protein [Clostridia bacterium]
MRKKSVFTLEEKFLAELDKTAWAKRGWSRSRTIEFYGWLGMITARHIDAQAIGTTISVMNGWLKLGDVSPEAQKTQPKKKPKK